MVRHFRSVLLLWLVSTLVSIGTSGISYFLIETNWFIAGISGFIAFWGSFIVCLTTYIKRFRKANEGNAYRKRMIRQAQKKVRELRIYKYKVRSLDRFRKVEKIYKLANQIVKVVKDDPTRYYGAKRFFHDYLDSTLAIVEKYCLFLQQPIADKDVQSSIKNTEDALIEMTSKFEEELIDILQKDKIALDMELEYIKHSINDGPREMTATKE